ncbi:MAG: metal-dependent transcriptional regulator [Candidatus Nanohaloarchaea archaeon]
MESASNYLRIIYRLTSGGEGNTTTSEVAAASGVSDASASEAIQKLEEKDLVCRAPYREFTLSPIGKEKGEDLARKHEILEEFFESVEAENPAEEADAAEHAVSLEAAKKIEEHIQ